MQRNLLHIGYVPKFKKMSFIFLLIISLSYANSHFFFPSVWAYLPKEFSTLTYECINCILKVNIVHGLEKELKIYYSETATIEVRMDSLNAYPQLNRLVSGQ